MEHHHHTHVLVDRNAIAKNRSTLVIAHSSAAGHCTAVLGHAAEALNPLAAGRPAGGARPA